MAEPWLEAVRKLQVETALIPKRFFSHWVVFEVVCLFVCFVMEAGFNYNLGN